MLTGRTQGRAARRRAARVLTTAALAVAALGLGAAPGPAAADTGAAALPVAREGGAAPGLPHDEDPGFPGEVPEIPDEEDDLPEIPDEEDEIPEIPEIPDEEGEIPETPEIPGVPGEGEEDSPDPFLDKGDARTDEAAAGSYRRGGEPGGAGAADGTGEGVVAGGRGPAGKATAEVSPATVRPGAHVTVSVSCPATGGSAPAFLDATSKAFEKGTVKLPKVPGHGGGTAGTAYRGTARIAPAGNSGKGPATAGHDATYTVDGTCPAAHGGKGHPWSAKLTVSGAGGGKPCHEPERPGTPCPTRPPCPEPVPHGGSCGDTPVPNGVHAGQGGAFTDSVPALVAGGVLIAGACGAAVHRLSPRRRRTTGGG
ncbi:hypothetical protein SUDANB145_01055 [Streptomyces sp. enrichment culture]|uniref:hypothetical protein n=1 Tax=Streptomyces sp. enrichment culture TaxID=1795815 RepID=UPI003F5660AC